MSGRLLRVLAETGLIEFDVDARHALVVSTAKTSLESSASFRAYAARLDAVQRYLGAGSAQSRVAVA